MKKKIIILLLLIIIITELTTIILLIPRKKLYNEQKINNIKNKIEETKINQIEQEKYTEEYKEYLSKTDEEKQNIKVIPRKEEVAKEELEDIIEEQKEIEIPSYFNLKDKIKINVENQGDLGICWAFSSMKTLETFLELHNKEEYNLSEITMDYVTSNLMYGNRPIHQGGSFDTFEEYLMRTGAKEQEENEYHDYTEEEYKNLIKRKDIARVTETIKFPSIMKDKYNTEEEYKKEKEKFRKAIKSHIMTNGAIYASLAEPTNINHYCAKDECITNHAVTIVGWDDDYKKENFKSKKGETPKNDGAYIAINSWGIEWGDNGYFYISYEDSIVETEMSGIKSTSLEDAYETKIINKRIKEKLDEKYKYTYIKNEEKEYITKLTLNNIKTLELDNLDIETSDIKGISIFSELVSLNLSNNKIDNIEELSKLSKISSLNIENNNITDLTPLKNLENLYILNASNNKNIKGFENIKSLAQLEINNCNIENIDISNQKIIYLDVSNNNLKSISLNNNIEVLLMKNTGIEHINDLKNIKEIGFLNLSENKITNLDGIEKISIDEIDLSNNNIQDYSKLKEIKLLSLILENNNIQDITQFNEINTQFLNLSNNKIIDISKYRNENVKTINLSNNPNIKQYDSLKDTPNIIIKSNNITNAKDLEVLTNVQYLDISNNIIQDITPLNNLEKLTQLYLDGNKNIIGTLSGNLEELSIKNCNLEEIDISKLSQLSYLDISQNNIDILNLLKKYDSEIYIMLENQNIKIEDLEKIINTDLTEKNQYINISNPTIEINITTPYDLKNIKWLSEIKKIENGIINNNYIESKNNELPIIIEINDIPKYNIYNPKLQLNTIN